MLHRVSVSSARVIKALTVVAALAAMLVLTPRPALAATFDVNNTSEGYNAGWCTGVGSTCNLRTAVQKANASPGHDLINIAGGTYTLSNGALFINEGVTLKGAGTGPGGTFLQNAASQATATDRVVYISAGAGVDTNYTVQDLTIQNGKTDEGGGMAFVANGVGQLTVSGVVIQNNRATLNGGGLLVATGSGMAPTVTITNSQILNNVNEAGQGGGLLVGWNTPVNISGTTISGNKSGEGQPSPGASVYKFGEGAGIYMYVLDTGGASTISNSTITNNYAYHDYEDVTFGGSGGGIKTGRGLTISNTVISNNNAQLDGGGINGSFIGDDNLSLTNVDFSGNHADRDGGGILYVLTTAVPIGGSTNIGPVGTINGGNFTNNTAGGNGGGIYSRVHDNGTSVAPSVTMSSFSVTNNTATGHGGGIYHDNYVTNAHTVTTLTQSNLTITGNHGNKGGGQYINGEINYSLTGTNTMSSNVATGQGGGLYISTTGTVGLSNLTANTNQAVDGGGIYHAVSTSAATTLNNVQANNNTATAKGGGIYLSGSSPLTLTQITTSNNNATGDGGGLYYNTTGSVSISSLTANANHGANGGGIYHAASTGATTTTATIDTLQVNNNTASGNGGGIYMTGSRNVTITNVSPITLNTATLDGGGLYAGTSGTVTMNSLSVTTNQARDGGGIFYNSGTVSHTSLLVQNNVATRHGGGVAIGGGTITVRTANILGNTASQTGGGVMAAGGTSNFYASLIASNTATTNGGGLYTSAGTHSLINVTVSGNGAQNNGGGLQNAGASFTATNTTVANNQATTGGGLYLSSGTTTIHNTIVGTNLDRAATPAANDVKGSVNLAAASSFNLIGPGGAGGLTNGSNSNKIAANLAEVGLEPLANYGGLVQTHKLKSTSLALDGGDNTKISETTDARGTGFTRKLDAGDADLVDTVDIGSYEAHPAVSHIADVRVLQGSVASKDLTFYVGDVDNVVNTPVVSIVSNTSGVLGSAVLQSYSGGTGTVRVTLNAGAYGQATVRVRVDDPDYNGGHFMEDIFLVDVVPPPDLQITKEPSDTLRQGDTGKQYKLKVTNVGAGDSLLPGDPLWPAVPKITVTDTFPAGLTPKGFSGTNWTCDPFTGQTATCYYNAVLAKSGGSTVLTLNLDVAWDAGTPLPNTASVVGGGDQTPALVPDSIAVTQTPDLVVTKTHGGDFKQGETGKDFTITVTNNGPGTTDQMPYTVTDTLPVGLTYAGCSGTGWSCTYNSGTRVVTGTGTTVLAPGESSALTLTVNVDRDAATGGGHQLTNKATTAGGGELSQRNTNNTSPDDVVNITQMPDLKVTKTAGDFYRNQQGAYTITVSNIGFATTSGTVTVEDVLDTNLTYVSGTGTGWTCSYNSATRKVSCTTDAGVTAAAGANFPAITLTVGVSSTSPLTLSNTATVDGGGQIWIDSNDTATVANHSVYDMSDLKIVKSAVGTNWTQGDTGREFSLQVTNQGAGPTFGTVTVTDVLNGAYTYAGFTGTDWSCTESSGTVTCTYIGAQVAAGAPFQLLKLQVDVSASAPPSVSNTASVAGGNDSGATPSDNQSTISTSIIQLPNLKITKSDGGLSFQQGQADAVYTITVENIGTGQASTPITVTDVLDGDLTYASATGTGWTCSYDNVSRTVSCSATGPIGIGTTSTITLKVDVARDATAGTDVLSNTAAVSVAGDTDPTNDSSTDTTTVEAMPDLEITKTAGDFYRNQQGAYTITVANTGFATTSDTVTVEDVLDTNLTYVSGTGTGWTCTYDVPSRKVSCTTDAGVTADPTESFADITITVGVAANSPLTLANTATVSGGGQIWVDSQDSSTVNHSVYDMSDLKIVKSAVGTGWTQGDTGREFSLQVTNQGAGPTFGTVTVTDVLNGAYTYAGFTGTDWSCTESSGTVTCTYIGAQVAAGASFQLLKLQVDVAGTAPPSVSNTASVVGGNDSGATPSDNQSTISTSIIQRPDLKVTKSDGGLSFQQGQKNAVYTITVENIGTGVTEHPVTLTDVLDGDLTLVSVDSADWNCSETGGTVTCEPKAATIAAGSTSTITITVNVARDAASGTNVLSNTATVSVAGDINSTNDASTETTTVEAMPDLEITKTAGDFYRNQQGAYTITVANTGFAPTSGTVTVEDVLDANLTFVSGAGTGWTCTYDDPTRKVSCTTNAGVTAAAGASFPAITLTVGVSSTSPLTLANTATVSGGGQIWVDSQDSSTVNHSVYDMSDLKIVKSAVGTGWTQGDTGREFSLQVTNQGAGPTFGTVTVTDVLDDAYTYAGFTGTDWSCPVAPIPGQTVTCTYTKQVSAGANFPLLTLQVDVAGTAPPTVANTATVAGGNDSGATPSDNESAISTSIVQRPDLKVTKSDGGLSFQQGQKNAVYTITVENIGTGVTEHPVTLTDVLDGDLTLVSVDSADWTCSETGGTVTCEPKAATIAAGSTSTITITVNVARDAVSGTDVLSNTATVSVAGDINSTNDASTETTTVVAMPDLEITKTAGSFRQGREATYTITVANTGFATTSGTVTVQDVLDANLTYVSGTGTGWTCTYAGSPTRKLTCTTNAGVVAAAGTSFEPITLTVGVSATAPVNLANTATAQGGGQIWVDSHDSTSVAHGVIQVANLVVEKTHTDKFTQGDTGRTFTIIVGNTGTGPTDEPVTVTDVLPAGFTDPVMDGGTNWNCVGLTCTTSVVLAPGDSYDPITLTVNVAPTAPSSQINTVQVSGGGEAITGDNTDTDTVSVIQLADLRIFKHHSTPFHLGFKHLPYYLTVTNFGQGSTSGTVTVTDTLPPELQATGMSGPGWTCQMTTLTCTRSDSLAGLASYPPITLVVDVVTHKFGNVVNEAAVAGGGEVITNNNTASDPTTILPAPPRPAPTYTVTISAPVTLTREAVITVSGTTEQNGVVQVGSKPVVADGQGNWSTVVPLVEGPNVITATVGDFSDSVTVFRDSTWPPITLTASATQTTADTVTLTATSEPGARIQIEGHDGATLEVKLKKGANTFTATATDLAGNTRTASVTVTRVEPVQESREVEPGSPLDLVLQFWALHLPAQTVTEPVLLTLQIPGTSEATQRAKGVATLISVTEVEAVTQDENTPVHQLEKKVTITFSYDPDRVPDPSKLRIFYYAPAAQAWVALESTVDPATHTVIAQADHFSLFAAMAATQTVPTLDALPATVSQAALQVTGKGEPGSAVSVLVNGAAAASGTVDNAGKFSLSVILTAGENRIQAITSGGALATGEALVTYRPAGAPGPNPQPNPQPPVRLTDVDGHWANKAIGEMVGLGVVKGYEDGTFRPENQVTRAEFAVMLGRLLKLSAGTKALTFTDANQIPEWARPSVGALVEAGIAITQPDGSFGPNVPATRAEMAVMLARALRYSGHSLSTASRQFTDSDQIPAWATELVSAAANAGLINGYPDGSFKPGNPASRAEAVTMFARLRKILAE